MPLTRDTSNSSAPVLEAPTIEDQAPSGLGRNALYASGPWDISELLAETSEEVVAREIERIEALVEDFVGHRNSLRSEMEPSELLTLMRHYDGLLAEIDKIGAHAGLWFSSDTQSSMALGHRNRIQQVLTRLQNRILFFELWWKNLEDEEADRLLPGEGEVDLRHYLLELRRFKPFTLDERSEQIINTKNANGINAVMTLYSMLTNRREYVVEIDGETRTLTEGEMRSQFYSPDPDLRAETYRELFKKYEEDSHILAQIYANRARDWHTEYVELRGMPSAISVRNMRNDIPDAAVETLLDVVHRNAPLFQEYFKLKGKWLGIEPLRRYDLYAPLAESNQVVSFDDAVTTVLDTFRSFDERFAGLAERVFADNHIDSEIRKGKRSGAFCATVLPEFTPWVMINYTDKVRDVATLAHELGHAVHSMMAEHHSHLTQHPSLPLAETASVFSEMLITDRLLAEESDPMARRELLAAAVDDVYATVMRQTFFVRFELAAHEAILANKSAEDLFDLYLENLREQFGDSMAISPELRYEWVSIPHLFNTPFYCYAYSFGQLLVLALYRRYQQEGDAFKPGYFRLLSYGGSARPTEILSEIGIDIADAEFWQGGFDVVRGMLDELKSIELP
ncbi:MAG: M3 family oligoendopeptidase [bacterium]|nr:M3 family oligoendopeptidase [bacterium]